MYYGNLTNSTRATHNMQSTLNLATKRKHLTLQLAYVV